MEALQTTADYGPLSDEVTLGTVIDGLSRVNRDQEAWMLYQNVLKDGRSPSPETCNTLMRMLCRKKRVSQVVSL